MLSSMWSFVFDIVNEKCDDNLKEDLKPYNNHSVGQIYIWWKSVEAIIEVACNEVSSGWLPTHQWWIVDWI